MASVGFSIGGSRGFRFIIEGSVGIIMRFGRRVGIGVENRIKIKVRVCVRMRISHRTVVVRVLRVRESLTDKCTVISSS